MKFNCKQLLVAFVFSMSFCNCQCENHVDCSTDIQLDNIMETNHAIGTPEQGNVTEGNSTDITAGSYKDLPDDIEQPITKQDD